MKIKYLFVLALSLAFGLGAAAQDDNFEKQVTQSDVVKTFTLEESAAAVSVISNKDIDHRNAKNIGGSILGQGQGLISLQGAGTYADADPTFYVRGLQTLNGNTSPLILVDGIEREITSISAEEVESVSILKDAAAVALYGYMGINGAILITTKRGEYNTQKVKFSYDHQFNQLINKPQFVNGYDYAVAINEARANDGLSAKYNESELAAFKSGQYPYSYPSVNWVDETFKNTASTDNFNMEFSGGKNKLRYFAMLDLLMDRGFINGSEVNEGYSTQDKYVRGNMRMNLDVDLTPTTDLRINVFGTLMENNRPGSNVDAWDLVYTVPSAAFPIHDEKGHWAGSETWAGDEYNPVNMTRGSAYYKYHKRGIFTDYTLKQDLSMFVDGLSAYGRISYDVMSLIYENHYMTHIYTVNTPDWSTGVPVSSLKQYGSESQMSSSSGATSYNRRAHMDFGLNYEHEWSNAKLFTQFKYDYDYRDINGTNQTIYRQNFSLWSHLTLADKFIADLTLMESGSSRLAPGSKWSFSPTLALGWIVSKEDGLSSSSWLNFLKLRASAGIINADYLPGSNVWSYYSEQYSTSDTTYAFTSSYSSDFGTTTLGRIPTTNPSHEKALKTNFGVDARLFGGLTLNADAYWNRRSGIWVSTEGKYTDVVGRTLPYENGGIVDSWGVEAGLDWTKKAGNFTFNLGGNFNFNRNKIVEMNEEPRLYENLVQTGGRVSQLRGLKAIGYFKDAADIANSPTQTFCTVAPGDIKYEDVNGDGVIDDNDKVAIGYSTTAPEIYFNFHVGAEWKGLGFYAMFQGAGNYSAMLLTKSMYVPLVDNTNISQYYFDNRWTTSNQNALFPRLSSQSNDNNYQNNTVFLADRSFLKLRNVDIYYNVPESFLAKTKFVKGAKFYVRGNDLFSLDKMAVSDPECYGTDQLYRSLVLGLSLTF